MYFVYVWIWIMTLRTQKMDVFRKYRYIVPYLSLVQQARKMVVICREAFLEIKKHVYTGTLHKRKFIVISM